MSDEGEGSNVINSTDAKRWVGEVEKLDGEAEAYRADLRERREGIFERAEAAGMPKAALKLEVWRRAADRKLKRKEEAAGGDQKELADMIREVLRKALGDDYAGLPLGEAAIEAAAPSKKKGRGKKAAVALVGDDKGAKPRTGADGEPDVRSTRQKDKEALRKADAEERLKGIKPLVGDDGAPVH